MYTDNKKALTLTEVIISLAIIGVLILIVVPNVMTLMPDDHAPRYKKAFYAIQNIVYDILNDPSICSGDNLSSCGSADVSIQIAKRLNVTVITPQVAKKGSYTYNTTDGMKLYLPYQQTFAGLFPNDNSESSIIVSLDGELPYVNSTTPAAPDANKGIFEIIIRGDGKVLPGNSAGEIELLKSK